MQQSAASFLKKNTLQHIEINIKTLELSDEKTTT